MELSVGFEVVVYARGGVQEQLVEALGELGQPVRATSSEEGLARLLDREGDRLVLGEAALEPVQLTRGGGADVAPVGRASPEQIGLAIAQGAVDWIQLPLTPADLARALAAQRRRVRSRHLGQRLQDALARRLQVYLHPDQPTEIDIADTVLHEVNNPLAALAAVVPGLRAELEAGQLPKAMESLALVEDVVSHLVAVARSGRVLLRRPRPGEGGDVSAAIRAAVSMTGSRSGLNVHVSQDGLLPAVSLPTYRLAQVLLNISLNAVTAGTTELLFRAWAGDSSVRVDVEDEGRGMSAGELKQALRRGYTTNPAGSGLGLSTCVELVESAGGRLSLESEQGRGTTVRLELPFMSQSQQP